MFSGGICPFYNSLKSFDLFLRRYDLSIDDAIFGRC